MIGEAKSRVGRRGLRNVDFLVGDALVRLETDGPFDGVFSSWVLGYNSAGGHFSPRSTGR